MLRAKRACAAEARLCTRGSQARSLFIFESGSGFSRCCNLSAHLFHELAHASDMTR
jgi:hypothetical protein